MSSAVKISWTLALLCSAALASCHRCPKPVEPVRPPPVIIVRDPPPCQLREKPLPVDTRGTVPVGRVIEVPPEVWSALIKRDLEWQAVYKDAKRCERPGPP